MGERVVPPRPRHTSLLPYARVVTHRIFFADRSERGKLRFSGEQRAWFLHQMLTQAYEDIAPGESRDAALITVHGRMQAYVEVVATDESMLMHFEPELAETLPEELRRYVFATRVTVEDVTGDYGLILVGGDGWADLAADVPDGVRHPTAALGIPAGYLWVPAARVDGVVEWLIEAGAGAATEEELEAIRIANGVPRWGRDMDTKTFPQEAGIDDRVVHYDKGCYLGQEAMAKIHFRGKVNRRLALLQPEEPVEPGAQIVLGDQKVGTVTSAADGVALALVRYTVEEGAVVEAGGVAATVAS